MSDHKLRRHEIWKQFLFPLFPIKILKSTKLLLILSSLFALRILFQLVSIPIPGIPNLSFSFGWIPLIILSWYFGPIYGIFCGIIMDSMIYLIFPIGIWFWMYAVQEPLLGLMAGILSSVCKYRQNNIDKINIIYDVLIQQIMLIVFGVSCYWIIITWLSTNNNIYDDTTYQVYRWLSLGLITAFFVIMEIFTFFNISQNKHNNIKLLSSIYSSTIVMLSTIIFSFVLGPISTVAYLQYINGYTPQPWIKYGVAYYLIPRVIVQCIKTPIESLLVVSSIMAIDPIMRTILNNIHNRWK